MEIEAEYQRRRAGFAAEFERANRRAQNLFLCVLGMVGVTIYTAYAVPQWMWAGVPAVVAAGVFWRQSVARGAADRAARLMQWYERGLGRVNGTAVQSGLSGEAFAVEGHLYARDLQVLGADSLFGMLATTRTAVGQRALAGFLLQSVDAEEARERQAAVRELAPLLELRERVALMGRTMFGDVPAEGFDDWLAVPASGLARWMQWGLLAVTLGWVGLIAAWLLKLSGGENLPRNVGALLAVQAAVAMLLRKRVTPELEAAQKLAGQTAMLRDGLKLLRETQFEAELLRRLQQKVSGENAPMKRLAWLLALVEQRAEDFNYAVGLMLAVGTQGAIALSLWRARHGAAMRRWVAAWAEFEALLAISTYAAEHAENAWPELVEESAALFDAEAVAHPLLPGVVAVANDVRLDEAQRFLVVSGSNMAGKSTLLRAMGLNAVLALAGAPVCARRLRMTAVKVGASLALVDSLAEGKSKFLAEVERLRDLVALAATGQSLFLIDEIFSGTNSADRRVAGEAVLEALLREGAIGALSTHDLALTELATAERGGVNVHMASSREDDPLGFDYVLKDGVNRTTNGVAIVRMMGL